MTASDSTAPDYDRVLPFTTLWESYTGADCSTIAVLFSQAADLLEARGYSSYSRDEDPAAQGLTVFEALREVARANAESEAHRLFGEAASRKMIDQDTASLAEELERRLAGVLLVTGQITWTHRNGSADDLWTWTREPHFGIRGRTRYRGAEHVTRLLRAAAVMTMAAVTAPVTQPR